MIRMGGPGRGLPAPDPEEERKMANQAVVGNALSFGVLVFLIHVSPYVLEQFGLEVVK